MKKQVRFTYVTGLLLLILFIATIGSVMTFNQAHSAQTHLKTNVLPLTGFTAPAFSLSNFNGNKVNITPEHLNKPIVINFWASWCPPCRLEAKGFEKVYKEVQGQVAFYGVNLTVSDSVAAAKTFAAKHHYTFPVLLDTAGGAGSLYQVNTLPTTLVIARNGTILLRHTGYMNEKDLRNAIRRLKAGGSHE